MLPKTGRHSCAPLFVLFVLHIVPPSDVKGHDNLVVLTVIGPPFSSIRLPINWRDQWHDFVIILLICAFPHKINRV